MRGRYGLILVLTAALSSLVGSQLASGAQAPSVSTGGTDNLTQTSAVLTGSVNPHGQGTTYEFQYGLTTGYGAQTATQSAGAGTKSVKVTEGVTNLTAGTKYHFRLVAQNASGTVIGSDKSFTTARQANSLAVAFSSSPVIYGRNLTVSGNLSGTPRAGIRVSLQARAYPYNAAFIQLGNTQLTDAAGRFRFDFRPLVNAQYRVAAATEPTPVVSHVTTVGVRVAVSLRISDLTPVSGQFVRFSGSVRPPHAATALVQRRNASGRYVTVARIGLRTVSSTRSVYRRRVRIRSSGRYRVVVRIADGDHVSGRTQSRYLTVH